MQWARTLDGIWAWTYDGGHGYIMMVPAHGHGHMMVHGHMMGLGYGEKMVPAHGHGHMMVPAH